MRTHSLLLSVPAAVALTVLLCTSTAGQSTAPEIPPYFKQLLAQGNVEFDFYDARGKWNSYPGKATFLLYVDHRYRFRYDTFEHDGRRYVKVRPDMHRVDCRVSHTVRLPDRFNTHERWSHWLVAHEFDHVAISTDRRPVMLVEHLLHKLRLIHRPVAPGETVDAPLVDRIVDEEIAKRRVAVQRLIQENYDLLDQVTQHGMRPIPDREAFFRSLYTKSNLDQLNFPYAAEASTLLAERSYRNVDLLYAYGQDHAGPSVLAAPLGAATQGWLRWFAPSAID